MENRLTGRVKLNSGVSQGSAPESTLSLVYTNDLENVLTNACFKFTEDVKVIQSSNAGSFV